MPENPSPHSPLISLGDVSHHPSPGEMLRGRTMRRNHPHAPQSLLSSPALLLPDPNDDTRTSFHAMPPTAQQPPVSSTIPRGRPDSWPEPPSPTSTFVSASLPLLSSSEVNWNRVRREALPCTCGMLVPRLGYRRHQRRHGCERPRWSDWALSLVPTNILSGLLQNLDLLHAIARLDRLGRQSDDVSAEDVFNPDDWFENEYW